MNANMSANEIAVKAWITAVQNGGDPEQWLERLGLTWKEVTSQDVLPVAKVLVEKYREEVLSIFPIPLRPYVMLTTVKPRRSSDDSTASSGTTSTASTASRGKAYQPKLDAYTWQYKGKVAVIRRVDGGWTAEYDGTPLGTHPSHTKAIEAVYKFNGVEAAINAVKLAKLREQDAAAGLADG